MFLFLMKNSTFTNQKSKYLNYEKLSFNLIVISDC